jgi:hypothetical protein
MGEPGASVTSLAMSLYLGEFRTRGGDRVRVVHNIAERVIRAYCTGRKPLQNLRQTSREMYPLLDPKDAPHYQPIAERTRPLPAPITVPVGSVVEDEDDEDNIDAA